MPAPAVTPADASRRAPRCPTAAAGALELALSSAQVSYGPDEKPEFRLTAKNTSAAACKTDLGPLAVVLTVSDDADEDVWSSKECPRGPRHVWLSVPAGGTVTHTVEWDRRYSTEQCDKPSTRSASPARIWWRPRRRAGRSCARRSPWPGLSLPLPAAVRPPLRPYTRPPLRPYIRPPLGPYQPTRCVPPRRRRLPRPVLRPAAEGARTVRAVGDISEVRLAMPRLADTSGNHRAGTLNVRPGSSSRSTARSGRAGSSMVTASARKT